MSSMSHSANPHVPMPGLNVARRVMRWPGRPDAHGVVWTIACLLAILLVSWILAAIFTDTVRFVVFNPQARTGFELFLALGQFFGALVLALSSIEPVRSGMRWVAMGLVVIGVGALCFGYLIPLFDPNPNANVSMYGSLLTRGLASVLLAVGLTPKRAPYLGRKGVFAILVSGGLVTLLLIVIGNALPELVTAPGWESMLANGSARIFPGLSGWHLALNLIPLIASLVALWGVARRGRGTGPGAWLVIGSVLFAGAQLHALFWPTMHSSILTTTSVIRFGWTTVIIAGGILELYGLSRERAALLAEQQERVRQLEELGNLKRDFTSMVAHELGTPLAAIGNLAQMITMGVLPEAEQHKVAGRIQDEARLLQVLVRDFQESADVERDDFPVRPQRVSLQFLMEDARTYAQTVQCGHPVTLDIVTDGHVVADPDRIGQVIRNLLNNAVRHTSAGTAIRLSASRDGSGVRIAVADQGPGIPPHERTRILEKFGRGAHAGREGRGLGLYLSRRILQAHGTDLAIESEPCRGASFSFRLEESS